MSRLYLFRKLKMGTAIFIVSLLILIEYARAQCANMGNTGFATNDQCTYTNGVASINLDY